MIKESKTSQFTTALIVIGYVVIMVWAGTGVFGDDHKTSPYPDDAYCFYDGPYGKSITCL